MLRIEVEQASHASGEHALGAFWIGQRRVRIAEVVDRWPGGDHCYYRVRADDGDSYMLRHDEVREVWEVVLHLSRDADVLLEQLGDEAQSYEGQPS